jgi:hypothetical protein
VGREAEGEEKMVGGERSGRGGGCGGVGERGIGGGRRGRRGRRGGRDTKVKIYMLEKHTCSVILRRCHNIPIW